MDSLSWPLVRMIARFIPGTINKALAECCQNDTPADLLWLLDVFKLSGIPDQAHRRCFVQAAKRGNVFMLEYLLARIFPNGKPVGAWHDVWYDIQRTACAENQPIVMEWYMKVHNIVHLDDEWDASGDLICLMCARGHMNMFQWFLTRVDDPDHGSCQELAVAQSGNLPFVKWYVERFGLDARR